MSREKRINIKLPVPKELFFTATKSLGLAVGAITTISNEFLLTFNRIQASQNQEIQSQFQKYQLSNFPNPPDIIAAFQAHWISQYIYDFVDQLNLPHNANLQQSLGFIIGYVGGPVLLGLALKANTRFPVKKYKDPATILQPIK